jgi:tRNA pseudouridine55 synthase
VGHAGTLDPLASGVMVLLLGGATRVAEYIQEDDKEYRITLLLGRETDTQDVTGATVAEADPAGVTREALLAALASFTGTFSQTPPAYSAIKVDGQPLYRLARKGIAVAPPPREVTIRSCELLEFAPPRAVLLVACSKGTYMRTLCHDAGRALGVGGCLETLVRTRSGRFALADAVSFSELTRAEDPDAFLKNPLSALPFPRFAPDGGEMAALFAGRPIPWRGEAREGLVAVVTGDRLVAVGEVRSGGLVPRKILEPLPAPEAVKVLCKNEEK